MSSLPRRFDDRPAGSEPLLSVVCAVRNGASTLVHLLDDFARQARPDVEFVVVDGDSTDATWSCVLARRGVVQAGASEPDDGIYDAWNKALALCRGRYVCFVGADDRLVSGALAALCECIAVQPPPGPHVISGYNVLTRAGSPVAVMGEPFERRRLPRRMMVAHVMAAHRRDWLARAGGFDSSYRSSGDYELLLREREQLEVLTMPTVLAYMADGGTSRQSWRPHLENFRARRKNGLGRWLAWRLLARAAAFEACRRLGLK